MKKTEVFQSGNINHFYDIAEIKKRIFKKEEITSNSNSNNAKLDSEFRIPYTHLYVKPAPSNFSYISVRVERINLLTFFIKRKRIIISPDDNFSKLIKQEVNSSIQDEDFLIMRIYEGNKFLKNLYLNYEDKTLVSTKHLVKENKLIRVEGERLLEDNGYNYLYSIKRSNNIPLLEKKFSLRGFFNHSDVTSNLPSQMPYISFSTALTNSKILGVNYLVKKDFMQKEEESYLFPVFQTEDGIIVGNRLYFNTITGKDYKRHKKDKKKSSNRAYSIVEQSNEDTY